MIDIGSITMKQLGQDPLELEINCMKVIIERFLTCIYLIVLKFYCYIKFSLVTGEIGPQWKVTWEKPRIPSINTKLNYAKLAAWSVYIVFLIVYIIDVSIPFFFSDMYFFFLAKCAPHWSKWNTICQIARKELIHFIHIPCLHILQTKHFIVHFFVSPYLANPLSLHY